MLGYSPEKKKIEDAKENLKKEFAQTRKEILASDLSDDEKNQAIAELLERIQNSMQILNMTREIDQIPEEDRESLGIEIDTDKTIDEKAIDTLVEIYADRVKKHKKPIYSLSETEEENKTEENNKEEIDTTQFEKELKEYFTEHYSELLSTGFNNFLSEFSNEKGIVNKKDGKLKEIAQKCNIDFESVKSFGYKFAVQDGLVAEEESLGRVNKIYYATQKGINDRLSSLYNTIVYRKANGEKVDNDIRRLKNAYIEYAEENGIEIEDKDVLEEIPVDSVKVEAIAKYINRIVNKGLKESGKTTQLGDFTPMFIDEITKKYSKIMNLDWYNFSDLDSVQSVFERDVYIDSLSLSIEEDRIIHNDIFRPDIAYGTPEYVKSQYETVMQKVKEFHKYNAFTDSSKGFDIEKANNEKEALRRYIKENGIEGIDISIPKVEIDHDMANKIADALIEQYGNEYEDKETMKARILAKLEDSWAELKTERQCIDVKDLIKDEMKEMGHPFVLDTLFVKDDFVHLSDSDHFNSKCIYSTPQALKRNISELDKEIIERDYCKSEERARYVLEKYAKENDIDLDIPSVEELKSKHKQEDSFFALQERLMSQFKPDDPTARPKIEATDSIDTIAYKISEGLPGAIVGIAGLLKSDEAGEAGFMLLLGLDDMNIRGSQIWTAYKYLYNENAEKFTKAVKSRDKKMVDFINQELASVGEEKAVTGGASFDRSKNPNKYRFTQAEVEELKQQKEERLAKEKEQREKMLVNTPAKKNRGPKKRAEREAKKQAYRQRLISMGKKSLQELDEELTDLQDKEKQAKQLCNQYEEQLPNKSHQEV